jgi:hypothetical protein
MNSSRDLTNHQIPLPSVRGAGIPIRTFRILFLSGKPFNFTGLRNDWFLSFNQDRLKFFSPSGSRPRLTGRNYGAGISIHIMVQWLISGLCELLFSPSGSRHGLTLRNYGAGISIHIMVQWLISGPCKLLFSPSGSRHGLTLRNYGAGISIHIMLQWLISGLCELLRGLCVILSSLTDSQTVSRQRGLSPVRDIHKQSLGFACCRQVSWGIGPALPSDWSRKVRIPTLTITRQTCPLKPCRKPGDYLHIQSPRPVARVYGVMGVFSRVTGRGL